MGTILAVSQESQLEEESDLEQEYGFNPAGQQQKSDSGRKVGVGRLGLVWFWLGWVAFRLSV